MSRVRKNWSSARTTHRKVFSPKSASYVGVNRELAEKYTALHEGRRPDRIVYELPVRQPKSYVTLGTVPEIIYSKKTPDGEHLYRHEFAEWAQPILAHDEKGKLSFLRQQNLNVTERGIEDMATRRIPRANPSEGGMRRMRSNPHFDAQMAKRVAMSTGVVGLVGLVVGIAMKAGFARFGTTLNPYIRAGIQAGVGVLGAIGLDMANFPTAAAGFGVGGVIAGGNEAYDYFQATRMAAPAAGAYYPYFQNGLPQPAGQGYPFQQQEQYCYQPRAAA